MFTKDPKGPATWEGGGLVPMFLAFGGATAIMQLLIKSWILYRRAHNYWCRVLGYQSGRKNEHLIIVLYGRAHYRFQLNVSDKFGIPKFLIELS